MGIIYTTLKLTNLFNRQQVEVSALVDNGATFMCVTEEIESVSKQSLLLMGVSAKSRRSLPSRLPLPIVATSPKPWYWAMNP